ncbi:hypothetical protein BAUCODRAFT_125251 [Baudoinia panamericana UAMH 10762]|uniref:Alpha/beta hydrolase fold-3 domain-containing protein n=1 Tax=Baudoinia panamericana (strain UAMH 10762) TaxID=717646 RepID=M2N326_BAUPA|nr:uncharacterized protein BAUCODRAFT_125251 [Baudoinia panamericana UAMH 10762]EMC93384.1 hypothetical protein BAUCODRAFT_125251 [Baudoinia panamericana UAMH 10762]
MLLSTEDLLKTSRMHPEIKELAGDAEPTLIEEERQIRMRDGYLSTIKIHRPAFIPAAGSPLVVLYFGGGWVSGSRHQLTPTARAFVRLFGAVVTTVDYRLAPESPFPTAQEDCWDSTKWIAMHARELHADPSKGFVVGGISAGGCSALVVANLAQTERLGPKITGMWISAAPIMEQEHVPEEFQAHFISREHNRRAPIITTEGLEAMQQKGIWDLRSPMRCPILFQDRVPLSSLPPAYFQVCGLDPLRDDGLIYEDMLKRAGVDTMLSFYPGCPHAHFAFFPGLAVSIEAVADIAIGVGWLLGTKIAAADGLRALALPS